MFSVRLVIDTNSYLLQTDTQWTLSVHYLVISSEGTSMVLPSSSSFSPRLNNTVLYAQQMEAIFLE